MTDAVALAGRDLALELHALLRDLDPARWRDDMERGLRQRLEGFERNLTELSARVRQKAAELEGRLSDPGLDERTRQLIAAIEARLQELRELVAEYAPPERGSVEQLRAGWADFRVRMQPAYESLAASLRAGHMVVPSLRPTNHMRSLLHMGSAAIGVVMVEVVFSPPSLLILAGFFFVFAWSLEISRRRNPAVNDFLMSKLGPFAHPHEWNRVNSATWYCTALIIMAATMTPWICTTALAVLGVGDPAASVVGRRFGRIKLVNNRSLEGTSAFILVSGFAVFGLLSALHMELSAVQVGVIAFTGALAGGLAELFSRRLDDNLTVPVAVVAACLVAGLGLGVL